MATKLEKDIVRESTIKIDDREILVTLTTNQEISMKLKGMRSGDVSINIGELYNQLTGNESKEPKEKKIISIKSGDEKPTKKNPMILLTDLRSHNAISGADYQMIVHFDQIIKNLIENNK